jgi:hypothetical protein
VSEGTRVALCGWVNHPLHVKKNLGKRCMGGYDMMCVMWVLNEFEPKEITNMVTSSKFIKQVLEEFLDVMPK